MLAVELGVGLLLGCGSFQHDQLEAKSARDFIES